MTDQTLPSLSRVGGRAPREIRWLHPRWRAGSPRGHMTDGTYLDLCGQPMTVLVAPPTPVWTSSASFQGGRLAYFHNRSTSFSEHTRDSFFIGNARAQRSKGNQRQQTGSHVDPLSASSVSCWCKQQWGIAPRKASHLTQGKYASIPSLCLSFHSQVGTCKFVPCSVPRGSERFPGVKFLYPTFIYL